MGLKKTERERLLDLYLDFNGASRDGGCFDCKYCRRGDGSVSNPDDHRCVLNPPVFIAQHESYEYPMVDIGFLNGCSHFKRASWLTRRKRALAWRKYAESEDSGSVTLDLSVLLPEGGLK